MIGLFFEHKYDQYALVPDTDGAGKYRGSLSVARDWRYIGETDVVFQLRTDRQKISPYGLFGGESGAISESILNPDTNPQRLRKQTLTLKKGLKFVKGNDNFLKSSERNPCWLEIGYARKMKYPPESSRSWHDGI